mmetsp:Transcript_57387/g.124799  ORF Transcript_57387/g.124799 Transcript_57387/m.124799 type:complete len:84 (-) Transcript_57387:118-369(-)|eukprot:CAMPEP_0116923308 /NCGR_PEP_ID=MMETSP0467-20121206/22803_1 /TAXON_ID=283647 /ORGANISM="Mesodinium pulex, Strain SPMC105" /LENGTH=83 /DNA_ID=CAMNT_0004601851 /DNA_START=514 /DNA_END=765 /DNA_ORIENTATION=+
MSDKLEGLDTTKLGLILNYTVFLYEIKGDKDLARELTRKTYEHTIDLCQEAYTDMNQNVYLLLQSFKDNLTKWEEKDDEDEDD